MKLVALVVFASVGCGGSQKPATTAPTPDPIPQTAGPSCKDVALHLGTLADRDPTRDATANNTLRARCESDRWSDDARSCFATAQSDDEIDGCKTKLSDAQRTAFAAAKPKAAADPWAAKPGAGSNAADDPPPPPPEDEDDSSTRRSRGPHKKGKTGSDPCEGGE